MGLRISVVAKRYSLLYGLPFIVEGRSGQGSILLDWG